MTSISVLLTGGPGGGKTSALATLRDRLTTGGFQVLVVPETASAIFSNSGGYDAAWAGTKKHVDLQEILMNYQMFQEDTYAKIAALRDKPCVLLHDRGLLEGKLFCTDTEWAESLRRLGTTEDALLKRYDMVIHMTSIASGMDHLYDFGPGSSNPARYHTAEQARETDDSARELYARHPQVRVVPNFPDFARKIDAVLDHVMAALHVDGLAGPRERELIAKSASELADWPVKRDVYDVQVTFLDSEFTECVRRRELVRSASASEGLAEVPLDQRNILYECRKELDQGERTIFTRQVLTTEAYHLLRERRAGVSVQVLKRSVCFAWEGLHYELCSYFDADGGPLSADWGMRDFLVLDKPCGAPLPPWLSRSPLAENASSETPRVVKFADCANDNDIAGRAEVPCVSVDKSKSTPRKLSRRTTADAAHSVDMRRLAKRDLEEEPAPKSPPAKRQALSAPAAEALLHSPSLSKAAAKALRSPTRA